MRKNTVDVFNAWMHGKSNRRQKSIWTDGEVIYSYRTVILVRSSPCILNQTRYSRTTTDKQRGLARLLDQNAMPWVGTDVIHIGSHSSKQMQEIAQHMSQNE